MSGGAAYQAGRLVVYGGNGVCRVRAVGVPEGAAGGKTYYTLEPLYGTEMIYVPVDTKVYLRPVMTRQEAQALIGRMPALRAAEVEEGNLQRLSRQYQAAFDSHSCDDLVRLLKAIYRRDAAARESGRRPGKVEEKYRKRAEGLLYGELSVALDVPVEGVPQYIRRALKDAGQTQAAS